MAPRNKENKSLSKKEQKPPTACRFRAGSIWHKSPKQSTSLPFTSTSAGTPCATHVYNHTMSGLLYKAIFLELLCGAACVDWSSFGPTAPYGLVPNSNKHFSCFVRRQRNEENLQSDFARSSPCQYVGYVLPKPIPSHSIEVHVPYTSLSPLTLLSSLNLSSPL